MKKRERKEEGGEERGEVGGEGGGEGTIWLTISRFQKFHSVIPEPKFLKAYQLYAYR